MNWPMDDKILVTTCLINSNILAAEKLLHDPGRDGSESPQSFQHVIDELSGHFCHDTAFEVPWQSNKSTESLD